MDTSKKVLIKTLKSMLNDWLKQKEALEMSITQIKKLIEELEK